MQLRELAGAGFAGVEISPIYGIPGSEARQVDFLSEKFTKRVAHVIREADRLGMRVDMILGTGWPFGGPGISENDRARKWHFESWKPASGQTFEIPFVPAKQPGARLVAAVAISESGAESESIPVRASRSDRTDVVRWTAPKPGLWRIFAAYSAPTGQKVKRAGPGGDGWVLDHFDPEAVRRYLAGFDRFLRNLPAPGLRCIFNDSWEVFGADCSAWLQSEFPKRSGIGWDRVLPALSLGNVDPESTAIRREIRRVAEEAVRENFLGTLGKWAAGHGTKLRNQAHGSPGNLIDLYAAVDIPECELFQGAVLRLIGHSPLGGTIAGDETQALEELLVCRMASSAAKLAGNDFASAEAFTWLGEHGRVPLSHLRTEAALLFACGVSQLVFHGSMASPPDLPWPGWTFYASTHVSPTTAWWRDLPVLNRWIAANQARLRQGKSEADFLVWVPFEDSLSGAPTQVLRWFSVHQTADWLRKSMPGLSAIHQALDQSGWDYDLVSDRLLDDIVECRNGHLEAGSGSWGRLLIPSAVAMPARTVQAIARLLEKGALVCFVDKLPDRIAPDGPSNGDDSRAVRLLENWRKAVGSGPGNQRTVRIGKGRLTVGPLETLLAGSGTPGAGIDGAGQPVRTLHQRRVSENGVDVFVVNADRRATTRVRVSSLDRKRFSKAEVTDLETGEEWETGLRRVEPGCWDLPLVLAPGESRWVHLDTAPKSAHVVDESSSRTAPVMVPIGPFELEAMQGPLPWPASRRATPTGDWTGFSPEWAEFSGTACYRCWVELPKADLVWTLDLGDVRHSVRVRIDGKEIGVRIAPPWRVELPADLPRRFLLELEVTNLDANRLAAMDRRKVPWKPFFLVNSDYKPFDASGWEPLPSGLLGPVVLQGWHPPNGDRRRKRPAG